MAILGLSIGLRGLLTAQANLDTVGHNISNANTPGYSRQTLQVSTGRTLNIRGLIQGTGVQGDVVVRTVDNLLASRITTQVSTLSRLQSRYSSLSDTESFLGVNTKGGIPELMQGFFSGLSSLSTDPDGNVLRAGAVQSTVALSSRFNQLSTSAESQRRETVLRLESEVSEVNALAREIGKLNKQITNSETGVQVANDLRDRRSLLIDKLAGFVDVRTVEDQRGATRILVSGAMLVSPTSAESMQLISDPSTGEISLRISGSTEDVRATGGSIGGLVGVLTDFLPKLRSDLDTFANALMLEFNRVHSTGLGSEGPFNQLQGAQTLEDRNGTGSVLDDLLAQSGLPVDIKSGELYVNVTDEQTGEMVKHKFNIDADRMTVGQFMGELNAIPYLSTAVDSQGRLQIFSDSGYGFDFSRRMDATPDNVGSLGGGRASLASVGAGPFAFAVGDTLDFTGASGSFSITINPDSFKQVAAATAEELAAVMNADSNLQANGLAAAVVGGHLVLQSAGSGSGESFDVTGGTGLAALGWSPGTTVTGQDSSVSTAISGTYDGGRNGALIFRPNMDGDIGTTPGLKLKVFDETGVQVAELDVGPGYTPGDKIDVIDGVIAEFSLGSLSATNNDVMYLDVVDDADSSDILPALGLNVLFTGSDADTMSVSEEIINNPALFASSETGAVGDASNLLRMLDLESADIVDLSGVSFSESFSDLVGSIALEINSLENTVEAEEILLDSLGARRDQVSGVNVDEELVLLIEQEQAFNAASQYIRVISELTNELMNII